MSDSKHQAKTTRTQPRREPTLLPVEMVDGTTSQVRLFLPGTAKVGEEGTDATTSGSTANPANSPADAAWDRARPLVVVWPGFGMGARYYDPIAWELADRGYPVVTGELRGQGSSTAVATRKHQWGYHHLASEDYPRTIRAAKEALGVNKDHPTLMLCHSMGGQIGALFLARPEAEELGIQGMMGVGSGTPYYKGFEGKQRRRLRFGTYQIMLNILLFGYQPAGVLDLAGYGRQSGTQLREWFRYGQTNRLHKLADQDMDYEEAKKSVRTPVLLTRCANDEDCPIASAENLGSELPADVVQVEELDSQLGHNRWAREPELVSDRLEEFWREMVN